MPTELRDAVEVTRKNKSLVARIQKLEVLQNLFLAILTCVRLKCTLESYVPCNDTDTIQVTSILCRDFGMGLSSSYGFAVLAFLARSGVQPLATRSCQRS